MAITMSTLFADLGRVLSSYATLNAIAGAGVQLKAYVFTVTAVSTAPTAGATYTNNGNTYTVISTVAASGTTVALLGTSPPTTAGVLTKAGGTGDSTVTFSAVTAYSNWIAATTSAITTAPVTGATYTNNSVTYTVLATMSASGTTLALAGNGVPVPTGTLTKAVGTGDSTVTLASIQTAQNWNVSAANALSYAGPTVKNQNTMVNDILVRLQGAGLTNLISYNGWQSTLQGLDASIVSQKTVLAQLAQQIIIQRVNNDVPQQNPTSLQSALVELIRQMQKATVTSIQAATVSASLSAGANNVGKALPYLSFKDANGLQLDYTFAETMVIECTSDQNSGASAGSEIVSVTCPAAVTNPLSASWPAGSGFTGTLTVVDPTLGYGSGGNLVGSSATGGAFKAWTMGVPNGWAVNTGGTIISDGTSANYGGTAHCLAITGDGSTKADIYQNFANGGISSGSTASLLPNTVYQFYAQMKISNASATGTVQVNLTDGSLNILTNNQGVNQTISTNINTGLSTSYTAVTGTFQTPTNMPTNCRLEILTSSAINNTYILYIDFVALVQPTAQTYGGLYTGGPFMSIFRGSTDLVRFQSYTIGDYWTYAVSNNYGSSSTQPMSFAPLLNATCNLATAGLVMPTAAAPTISDNLIN